MGRTSSELTSSESVLISGLDALSDSAVDEALAKSGGVIINKNIGGGDVFKVNTPVNNQIGVWTGDGTIKGTSGLTYDGTNLQLTGDIGSTGSRITKAWLEDLEVTNSIVGDITGSAETVNTINGATMTLGSDADGDMYYRNSNILTRLPKGTASQVLSMNIGATAPEWIEAPSTSYSIELGESMTAGDLARIVDDGGAKLMKLIESGADFGAAYDFNLGSTNHAAACLISSGKIFVAWQDGLNSSYGTGIVGTINGSVITFGLPVVFALSSSNAFKVKAIGTDKVFIAYTDAGNSNQGTGVVGNIEGTVPSFGIPVVFDSSATSNISVAQLGTDKAFIAYENTTNKGYCKVVSISGTVPSYGTLNVFHNASISYISATKIDTDKVAIAYSDGSDSDYGYVVISSVTGTSIVSDTANRAKFISADSNYISITTLETNKVFVAFSNNSSTEDGTGVVGTITSTTPSFGLPVTFSTSSINNINICLLSTGKVYISYRDVAGSNHGKSIVGNVSGTVVTYDSEVEFNGATTITQIPVAQISNGKTVTIYRDGGDSNIGKGKIFVSITANLDDYSAILNETGTAGETKEYTPLGSVNSNQTGMTPGAIQYIDDDGSLTEVDAGNGIAGIAASATEIISTKTPSEIKYLIGVTSSIQDQLDSSGDVTASASSTDSAITLFDGITGKLIKDSGITIDDNDSLGTSDIKISTQGNVKAYVDSNLSLKAPIASPVFTGNISIPDQIFHVGDTDNYRSFGTDTQDFVTGGSSRLDLSDSGVRFGATGARITSVTDSDSLGTSDTVLCTQGNVKAYVDNSISVSDILTSEYGLSVTDKTTYVLIEWEIPTEKYHKILGWAMNWNIGTGPSVGDETIGTPVLEKISATASTYTASITDGLTDYRMYYNDLDGGTIKFSVKTATRPSGQYVVKLRPYGMDGNAGSTATDISLTI